jgi:FO synthase subunit 1
VRTGPGRGLVTSHQCRPPEGRRNGGIKAGECFHGADGRTDYPALLATVHRHAPSKRPELRLQQLNQAGALGIPFTTGLLLGLGETQTDWVAALQAIADSHRRYGHIQEVILQPHSPGHRQTTTGRALAAGALLQAVQLAREHLPADITLQIPPNLVSPGGLLVCLEAGARDIGGISPVDEVNPDYDHPYPQAVAAEIAPSGWQLTSRLPVYPQYDSWLPADIKPLVQRWRNRLAPVHRASSPGQTISGHKIQGAEASSL